MRATYGIKSNGVLLIATVAMGSSPGRVQTPEMYASAMHVGIS
jgi:hypothetical protein